VKFYKFHTSLLSGCGCCECAYYPEVDTIAVVMGISISGLFCVFSINKLYHFVVEC
jgi:hypothetical protein